MKYTREEHVGFLERELKEQTSQYITKIQTSAISLLKKDEVFASQFVKFENGQLILKLKNERGLPRKGDFFTAILLQDEKKSYKNWGSLTWADLRKKFQLKSTEAVCIWHSKTKDEKFSYVGFRNITIKFAQKLVNQCIVVLGPKEPPFQYIHNLIKIVKETPLNTHPAKVLDSDFENNKWNPIKITEPENIEQLIIKQLATSKEVLVQGPPGTGKTFLMAQVVSVLLSEDKSILVTALTNRALMELAHKPALKNYLSQKKVYKTNLTIDEKNELPNLQSSEIICSPGILSLSTFFISSSLAAEMPKTPLFDYVIMDEASQSLLAMFCATKILGGNVIWIGDTIQLPPIVSINTDTINKHHYGTLVNGMLTLAEHASSPFFQLTNSYRLSDRGAEYTGLFYENSLTSKSTLESGLNYNNLSKEIVGFFNKKGGPTLIKTNMPAGDCYPEFASSIVMTILSELLANDKKLEIAVLTKLKKTVNKFQKDIAYEFGSNQNLIVETTERVQGLTTDITIFFIPNTMMNLSLKKELFNVATSRAKMQTIIIADKNILNHRGMDNDVRMYLQKLSEDFCFVK